MSTGAMISFVGAGPGAADLITLRGAARLAEAEIIVWASSLVPRAVLDHASPRARVHDSAGMTLEDVLEVYARNRASRVVRLHSGDPSLYGAIQEQVDWCVQNRRDFEIVPGVSSLGAASAALGRELTLPGISQSVVLTRLAGRTKDSVPERESVARFAAHGATMAVFLSAARPGELQGELLAEGSAYSPDTPVAIVVRATWPEEHVVCTRLGDLSDALGDTGARTTVLVLVGAALGEPPAGGAAPERGRSRLYSPSYAHKYRRRSAPGSTAGRPAASRPDRGPQ